MSRTAEQAGFPADEFPPWAVLDLASLSLTGADMPGIKNRLVLHTTESLWYHPTLREDINNGATTYDGFGHPNFPTWTLDRDGTLYVHCSARRTSRALLNPPGGVETNRWNVVQVEIVGVASGGWAGLTDAQKVTLRRLVWWCIDHGYCTLRFPPQGWAKYPDLPAARRFSPDEWRAWDGICGHEHVTENTHRDPGDFTAAEPYLSVNPNEEEDPLAGITIEQIAQVVEDKVKAALAADPASAAETNLSRRNAASAKIAAADIDLIKTPPGPQRDAILHERAEGLASFRSAGGDPSVFGDPPEFVPAA
ncbi:MAG TPA: hypothetical protein VGB14_00445 [Acidimicrobiales bacterium]|jgi:hypothetical protein